MAKKTNDKPLKEVLDEMLNNPALKNKFLQNKLILSWEKIMGKTVANRTTKIYFRDKKLFVYLSSASLRQELLQAKIKIMQMLNEEVGTLLIEDIVFS
jgi:predicted nucleic acid-binding Zn ribbon protein